MAASLLTGAPLTYTGKMAMDYVLKPAVKTGKIEDYMKVVFNVKTRQQVIFTKPIYKITRIDGGCGTGGVTPTVVRTEKWWEPQSVKAWVPQCWQDLKGTIFEEQLKAGNDISDLTNTQIEEYMLNLLEPAAYSDFMRMAWLSKKTITGAELTGGNADVQHYNQIDGAFEKINQGVAANLIQRYTIEENGLAAGAQRLGPGRAYEILDAVLEQAPIVLKQVDDSKKVLFVTREVYENYQKYLESNSTLEITYTNLVDGQKTLTFRGIPLIILNIVDQFLEADFKLAGKVTQKHRVILTVKDNFQIGLDGESTDPTALEVWYERKDEIWNGRLKYKLAFMIAEEDYVSVAL
jgi:hypothetical protein